MKHPCVALGEARGAEGLFDEGLRGREGARRNGTVGVVRQGVVGRERRLGPGRSPSPADASASDRRFAYAAHLGGTSVGFY